jgi:hypothetical protein
MEDATGEDKHMKDRVMMLDAVPGKEDNAQRICDSASDRQRTGTKPSVSSIGCIAKTPSHPITT